MWSHRRLGQRGATILRRLFLLLAALFWLETLWAQIVPGYYVVELTEEPPVEIAAKAATGRHADSMRDRSALVHAQQRLLHRMLRSYGAELFASVDTVANALLVRIPDDRAASLRSIPGVQRLYPVCQVRPSLERALPRHKVPEAWARLGGGDLAGAGARIAIIDTGIDPVHPGMIDPSMPMPEGFPRVNRASDLAFTSNKIIVARSYLSLFSDGGDISARDKKGHGTAVATAAAGVVQESSDGPISGVAPKAYLGNYTVFPASGNTRTDIVLKAIDDAVRDGMDVINLSLGSPYAVRPEDDIFTRIAGRRRSITVPTSANAARQKILLIPITAVSASVTGPVAFRSRITIRVEAGAVAMAMAPSSSATGHGCPRTSIATVTNPPASTLSVAVTWSIAGPATRTRRISKIDPMENRISPSATSLKTSSAAKFS